ncbi:MAG: activator of (R)-2-hydroxyglutaryl-CoA dehydratase [Gemmatimonadota bacterium]|nr:activator of (R)-2-hydroxyglutaryl-CoA dehydratase [Gemmatimonadota bacterium]
MKRQSQAQFKRPVEHPFTADQRDSTTVLLGGLSPRHDRLLEASLRALGYRCKALPNVSLDAYECAREYGNNGQCNPTYFTVGNLVKYVQGLAAEGMSREEIIDSHVFVTAGSCGTCRFGMYEAEYRYALMNAGFEGFRVLLFGTDDGIDQSTGQKAGLDMNLDFFLGIITAFNVADVLNQFHYKTRGYEVTPGAVDAATDDVLAHLEQVICTRAIFSLPDSRAHFLSGTPLEAKATYLGKMLHLLRGTEMVDAMAVARDRYDQVELDPFRVKPIVKIIGEFWAQTTEGQGNFNMHRFLEHEGAEVFVDRSLFTRLMYLLHMHKQATLDRKGLTNGDGRLRHYRAYYRKRGMLTLAEKILKRENDRLLEALGGGLHEMASQYELERLARPYWNWRTSSGESHLEIAENIYYHQHHLCHMVLSLKPFSCMPSTQSDGVQTRVVEYHPGMIYLPIETSGDGEVIAHSRVQMALGGARTKARKEMARVLEASRWTIDELRSYADDHPDITRASYAVPHHPGIVGRAANMAIHVGSLLAARPPMVAQPRGV